MTGERKVLGVALSEAAVASDVPIDVLVVGDEAEIAQKLKALTESSFSEARAYYIPSDAVQAQLFSLIQPKGKLLVDGVPDRNAGQELSLNLRIQGFVDIMAAKDPGTGSRFVVCQRPDVELGSTAAVNIAAKVKIGNLAEDEFVDENALLAETEADVQGAATMDCGEGNGARRACANCTCGMAEKEKEKAVTVQLTVEEQLAKASGCGNCTKGDAFRCASCPYLGLPAFEPGQETVMLSMRDDF